MPQGRLPANLEKVADAGGWEGRAAEVEKAMNAMSSKKTQKGAKEMGGMFKSMKGAGGAMPGILGMLQMIPGFSAILSPLLMIMKPFEPILKIVGGLLTVMMGEALGPIMKFIKPFLPLLMSMTPIFTVLGRIIAILVIAGLIPLVLAIYVVGIAIAYLIDLFTGGAAGAVNAWNNMMLPALGSAMMAIPEVFAAQHGAYVPQTPGGQLIRVGEGGEGEHIIPGSQMEGLIALNTKMVTSLEYLQKEKMYKRRLSPYG